MPNRTTLIWKIAVPFLCLAVGAAGGYLAGDARKQAGRSSSVFMKREGGYRFINPLLECERSAESLQSEELRPFRTKVEAYLRDRMRYPGVESASVYFRELNDGIWFSKRQMGILTLDEPGRMAQIVFVDTPGLHRPRHKLGELMNRDAVQTLEESDVILFVADASQPPNEEDHLLFELLSALKRPAAIILALNKHDAVSTESFETHSAAFKQGVPSALALPISATRGDHLADLLDAILERLPEGPPFFPEDQLTDLYEREIAADLIREASLILLRDEIPHGIAVRIDHGAGARWRDRQCDRSRDDRCRGRLSRFSCLRLALAGVQCCRLGHHLRRGAADLGRDF